MGFILMAVVIPFLASIVFTCIAFSFTYCWWRGTSGAFEGVVGALAGCGMLAVAIHILLTVSRVL